MQRCKNELKLTLKLAAAATKIIAHASFKDKPYKVLVIAIISTLEQTSQMCHHSTFGGKSGQYVINCTHSSGPAGLLAAPASFRRMSRESSLHQGSFEVAR